MTSRIPSDCTTPSYDERDMTQHATEAEQEQVAANCERLCKIALLAAGYSAEFDAVAMDTDDERPHVRLVRVKPFFCGYLVAREEDGTWTVETETTAQEEGNIIQRTALHGAYQAAAMAVAQIAADRALCAFSDDDMEPCS